MINFIKKLRNKFKKHNIDGYVVPKNDDYFTEYSKINRLKIISNFTGSAGIAVILKNTNYLFTDGRYTIQSQIESGKEFKIIDYRKYKVKFDKIVSVGMFEHVGPKNYLTFMKTVQRNLKKEGRKSNKIAQGPDSMAEIRPIWDILTG